MSFALGRASRGLGGLGRDLFYCLFALLLRVGLSERRRIGGGAVGTARGAREVTPGGRSGRGYIAPRTREGLWRELRQGQKVARKKKRVILVGCCQIKDTVSSLYKIYIYNHFGSCSRDCVSRTRVKLHSWSSVQAYRPWLPNSLSTQGQEGMRCKAGRRFHVVLILQDQPH